MTHDFSIIVDILRTCWLRQACSRRRYL